VSPSNPIIIQCRINPDGFYDTPTDSDYLAPPFTLVFAKKNAEKTSGINSNKFNLKRKREGDVHDVITNMYNVGDGRNVKHDLRCIGVTYDGILDAKGAKKHPDKVGRLAVVVSGAITVLCNKDDLKGLSVGDMLEWRMEDNGQIYNGLSREWSTARIGKASGGKGVLALDTPYESLFGPKKPYTDNYKDDMKEQIRLIESLKSSLGTFSGCTPKKIVEAVAHYTFSLLPDNSNDRLSSRSEWIEKLYRDPTSPYFTGFAEPQSDDSIHWIEHCFGKKGGWGGWCNWIGTSWLSAENAEKIKTIKSLSTIPDKNTNIDDYLMYKAFNRISFDSDDMALLMTKKHYGKLSPSDATKIADFIKPLIETDVSGVIFNEIYKELGSPHPTSTDTYDSIYEVQMTLAKTSFDFYNISAFNATSATDALTATGTPDVNTTKKAFARALNLHHEGGSSNMFGMLLEKNHHSNEARVLLCPSACM
jgi:hypothetical protein